MFLLPFCRYLILSAHCFLYLECQPFCIFISSANFSVFVIWNANFFYLFRAPHYSSFPKICRYLHIWENTSCDTNINSGICLFLWICIFCIFLSEQQMLLNSAILLLDKFYSAVQSPLSHFLIYFPVSNFLDNFLLFLWHTVISRGNCYYLLIFISKP